MNPDGGPRLSYTHQPIRAQRCDPIRLGLSGIRCHLVPFQSPQVPRIRRLPWGVRYDSGMLAAAWVTAAATVGLLVGAAVTAVFAIRAFGAQSREVSLLQEQVETERSEREREATERRREQAARVYVTLTGYVGSLARAGKEFLGSVDARAPSVTPTVHNTSEQPVYGLRVHWIAGDPAFQVGVDDCGTLSPGQEVSCSGFSQDGATSGDASSGGQREGLNHRRRRTNRSGMPDLRTPVAKPPCHRQACRSADTSATPADRPHSPIVIGLTWLRRSEVTAPPCAGAWGLPGRSAPWVHCRADSPGHASQRTASG